MLRALIRRMVPGPVRAGLRRAVADARYRRQDFAADLRQRFTGTSGLPLPPAALRHRVGPNSSRAEFLHVGALCAGDLLQVYRQLARPPASDLRWLDFGCGCGRVARHLLGPEAEARFAVRDLAYTGVDVDRRQVAWAARHLPGTFAVIPMSPPTALPGAAFDVIFTISVFTQLEARGFLFRPSVGPFNEQSTFHSEAYLRASWSRHLELRGFFPKALGGFQDISAWEKREPV